MPYRNNSVKQTKLEDQNQKMRWRKRHMFKWYEPYASCEPTNDCHQMTFLTTRRTATILIVNLRYRQTLPLTLPAVSSRGGQTRHERSERRKSSLPYTGLLTLHSHATKLGLRSTSSNAINLITYYHKIIRFIISFAQSVAPRIRTEIIQFTCRFTYSRGHSCMRMAVEKPNPPVFSYKFQ